MGASDIKSWRYVAERLSISLRAKIGDYDMNSTTVSYFSKTLVSIIFAAALIVTPKLGKAQDYTEEQYKIFQDVQAEKDDVKKVDTIVSFLKENPKNGLRPNMVAEYQKAMISLKNEKKWNQIIALGEKFLAVAPGDDFTEGYLAASYAETNNPKGFVEFGEKLYASKPNADLAMEIARNYQKLGNEAKYLQWKEKVAAANPENVEVLAEMIQKYSAKGDMPTALKYAKQCLNALPSAKKPAGVDDAAWKTKEDSIYAAAYAVIGQDAYQHQRYAEAIKNLESAVKYLKRFDNAYFILGMCYWQTNKIEAAMLNFAKAYVIRGTIATQAKQQLDKMWKDGHKGTLAGEERMVERAQQDLK
jgi:tetratricopeptide (TPR) repeat protein